MPEGPILLSEVLTEEYVRLHVDENPTAKLPAAGADEKETLKNLFKTIHEEAPNRSALCISGGGIRSATFALGVIQRLAKVGVLEKFDYLSTVSGGGYIGSWLSSYARRHKDGMPGVSRAIGGNNDDPLQPEAEPLMWLRRFSNYLTPRLGLLSGDTWAFAGSYIRNLLLVWLMFVPLLIATLAVPRLSIALLRSEGSHALCYLVVAAAAFLFAASALAWTRPVSYRDKGWLTNKRFQWCVFVPFLIFAVCLVLYWGPNAKNPEDIHWPYVYGALIILSALASTIYMVRFILTGRGERRGNVRLDSSVRGYNLKKFAFEVGAAAVSGAVGAALCQASARWLFDDPLKVVKLPQLADWTKVPPDLSTAPGELFLCFGVPLVLGILFIQSTIFVGGASWFNEEYDREWWGRAAGWVLVAAVIWIVFTVIAIYGPVLLYNIPKALTAIGGVTGLISILGGKSGKTAANEKEEDETAKLPEIATNIALALAAPVFVVVVLAGLSLVTSRVMFPIQLHGLPSEEQKKAITDAQFDQYSQLPDAVLKHKDQHHVAGCADTLQCPEIDPWKERAMEHLWAVDHTKWPEGLILVFGMALFGFLSSFFLGVNQFSMHGLYRNRLVRAYLGASRLHRKPNAFSGFDPNDNMPMQWLRPETFRWDSFTKPADLIDLLEKEPRVAEHVQRAKDAFAKANNDDSRLAAAEMLADDLNRAIDSGPFGPPDEEKSRLPLSVRNRDYLEKKYDKYIASYKTHRRPIHVVNTALNLVAGENLAWQERKAESFGISPFYSGSWVSGEELGYRHTREYGGPAGITLGTAVAISGAAASPNMGYHSSPALSFLLTLFNVRLGWWLGNTGAFGNDTYTRQNPKFSLYPLLCEAFGATDDTFPYVYLSDGGHFDNLGLYEMVLRRCRNIVVSDGGGDPTFDFEDLGNAIRKIRIDLGINITIKGVMGLYPRSQKDPVKPIYCAVAEIDYSTVDSAAKEPGKLLYIKPAFYGKEEPKDVYNYAIANATFPHQTTGDQWFSESQFESYRALGEFELTKITKDYAINNVGDLIDAAEKYIEKYGPKP